MAEKELKVELFKLFNINLSFINLFSYFLN